MTFLPLSRDLALRIGLAARELPDTDARRLMNVLVDAIGAPLTDDKLKRVTVKDLRKGADGDLAGIGMDSLKAAVRQLWGEDTGAREADESGLPESVACAEGDLPGSIRVAIASNSGEMADGHFGSCLRFLVYQVAPEEARLIDVRPTRDDREAEEKNAWRAERISDCHILYTASIGGPAAAKVIKANIHPIKLPQGGETAPVLDELRRVLAGHPPPWLARVMGCNNVLAETFTDTEDEV